MARYLERLVARAGIANDAPPASPRPRAQYERDAADPFDSTAPWESAPAPVQAAAAPPQVAPVVLAPLISREPVPNTIVDSKSTEIRIEKHRDPIQTPVPPERFASPPEPPSLARSEIVHEIELRPQPEIVEREIRAESIRAEKIIERETIRAEAPKPTPPAEPATINTADIERNVLGKLMPALDAWFASGAPDPPTESPHRFPLAPTLQRAAEPDATAATEIPQLVIGSIRVEVTAPPSPVPVHIPRPRSARPATQTSRPTPSRLGFGLGQM
jgi:hypothetical protein